VPQREQFEDVYPSGSDDEKEIIEEEDPDDTFGVDRSKLNTAEMELKALEDRIADATNQQNTANTSLETLDLYGKSLKAEHVDVSQITDYLHVYEKERSRLAEMYQKSTASLSEMKKEKEKLRRKKLRVDYEFNRARDAAAKSQRQEREKKKKARELKLDEKDRVRDERMKFWPYTVAKVVLHLDGLSDFTPGSSRRGSIVSTAKKPDVTSQGPDTVSFSLNYVTSQATWSPRYELNLETPTSSGKIVYRAEYHNYSSEIWKDTHLILSTSQTSFSGLEEKTPNLRPWNVKLRVDDSNTKNVRSWQGGLENRAEIVARTDGISKKPWFGNNYNGIPQESQMNMQRKQKGSQQMQQMQMQQQQMAQQQMQQIRGGGGFGSINNAAPQAGGLFGSGPANNQTTRAFASAAAAPGGSRLFGAPAPNPSDSESTSVDDREVSESDGESDADGETLSASTKALEFQETSRQDYGLTTTYEIPGQRTIRPSSLKRRHVIAELSLSAINFSHVIVPKLRAAAFLRARVTNTSSISLLRGKAGLTLDGTFLGTTAIPSCSPDSAFSLSLGVDPGIQVTYAKPTVRRATSGFFNKEDCAIFTRICRITNTKTTPVSIAVLDQVPVSEDERLRVGILEPKGLNKEGDQVNVGPEVSTITTTTTARGDKSWGKGTVGMGKGGNVTWQLTLEKGKAVKLTLEYEARIPSGQKIVGLD
jgi:hypothetical protein